MIKVISESSENDFVLKVNALLEQGYKILSSSCGFINNEPTIDHIDRNKDNNCIDNLRWASNILQANNKDKTKIIENMRKLGKSGKGLKVRWS